MQRWLVLSGILLSGTALGAIYYYLREDATNLAHVRTKPLWKLQHLSANKSKILLNPDLDIHSTCLSIKTTHSLCGCDQDQLHITDAPPIDYQHLSVPPGLTYTTIDRNQLVDNIALSMTWADHSDGVLSAWHCSNGTLTQVSTEGLTFAGFANNSEIRTTLSIASDGTHHSVKFPDCTPPGIYDLVIVLVHMGGQGMQDPPCFQDLKVRTHCLNETLWLDQFSRWFEVGTIKYSTPCRPTRLKASSNKSRLTDLTPGYWNMSTLQWTPTAQFSTPIDPPRASDKILKKALLVGDSTFRNLELAASNFSMYVKALTPADLQRLLQNGIRQKQNNTVLFLGIGLHPTCYHNLKVDIDHMKRILPQIKAIWKDDFVIRSTPVTSIIRGLDYNDKKCLYYTRPRLQMWNDHIKVLADKNNITYWDVVDITASVGPSPGKWAETDGTHFCFPNTGSDVCQQMVSMLLSVL